MCLCFRARSTAAPRALTLCRAQINVSFVVLANFIIISLNQIAPPEPSSARATPRRGRMPRRNVKMSRLSNKTSTHSLGPAPPPQPHAARPQRAWACREPAPCPHQWQTSVYRNL